MLLVITLNICLVSIITKCSDPKHDYTWVLQLNAIRLIKHEYSDHTDINNIESIIDPQYCNEIKIDS